MTFFFNHTPILNSILTFNNLHLDNKKNNLFKKIIK